MKKKKKKKKKMSAEVIYTDAKNGIWEVFDRVTYVCRRASFGIQPTVTWRVDPGEYYDVEYLEIEIQWPYTHPERGNKKLSYKDKPNPKSR